MKNKDMTVLRDSFVSMLYIIQDLHEIYWCVTSPANDVVPGTELKLISGFCGYEVQYGNELQKCIDIYPVEKGKEISAVIQQDGITTIYPINDGKHGFSSLMEYIKGIVEKGEEECGC